MLAEYLSNVLVVSQREIWLFSRKKFDECGAVTNFAYAGVGGNIDYDHIANQIRENCWA